MTEAQRRHGIDDLDLEQTEGQSLAQVLPVEGNEDILGACLRLLDLQLRPLLSTR